MDKRDAVWEKVKLLLREHNFVTGTDFPLVPETEVFLNHLEMLILQNKINLKRRLSSRIYLAMLHRENKEVFNLISPSRLRLNILILMGKLLGFRV